MDVTFNINVPVLEGLEKIEIESAREDCAFVFITHDLEFASSRVADKYVLKEHISRPNAYWSFEKVPVDTGFDEELTTLILGSRKPVIPPLITKVKSRGLGSRQFHHWCNAV